MASVVFTAAEIAEEYGVSSRAVRRAGIAIRAGMQLPGVSGAWVYTQAHADRIWKHLTRPDKPGRKFRTD